MLDRAIGVAGDQAFQLVAPHIGVASADPTHLSLAVCPTVSDQLYGHTTCLRLLQSSCALYQHLEKGLHLND